MQLGRTERRKGKERRSGRDRRKLQNRHKFEDRRSGEDRGKSVSPRYEGVEGQVGQVIDEEPKCQRCAAILREMRVLILECPFPEKACLYKRNFEIIHYVTYPSARVENGSAVVASSSEDFLSPSIILIRPDPILKDNQIYFIDVTESPTV